MNMYFAKMKLKGTLNRCFKLGGIHKQIKTENKTYIRYPIIHEVHIDKEHFAVRYTFTLPNGCDPDLIHEQHWIFHQHFGSNIEIKGNGYKKFILWVYINEKFDSFKFDYDEIVKYVDEYKFPILAGKDAHGCFHMFDMIKDPNMLITGETGAGKSMYLRSLLTFLTIYMGNNIEMYLADLKRTEFHIFRNLKNVKCNVTTKEDLMFYLLKIKKELQRRGDLFNESGVAHIDDYNALPTTKKALPYLLLCIDEFALLKKKGKEDKHMPIIEEISCISRALGCLLILSMQRGDATLLDGMLKNNLTCRVAFRCADKINSKIALGTTEVDASTILKSEKGKFYFKMEDINLLQAPLLDLEDAKKLLEPYKISDIQVESLNKESQYSIESLNKESIQLPKFTIPEGVKDDERTRF